jgi:uncharacterized membrane protein
MTNNQKRDIATSLTTLVFLIVGTTGVFMYFHILDKYTKDIHEILGLAFVAVVFFHVLFNWKSMKQYFSKKVFLLSTIFILFVTIGFIVDSATEEGEHPKKTIIVSMLKAPLEDAISILGQDMDIVTIRLNEKGIKIENEASLKELAKNNDIPPFELVSIITNN